MVPEVEQWTPLLERYLQRALRGSLDKLEPGLVAIDGGREDGFRDITAKDQAGNTVVIELKAGKAGKDAVGQLLTYMGQVKAAQNPSGLRGILVALDFQATAVAAAAVVPNIALLWFRT
jgi:RecB family endonuclease NucS